MHLHLIVEAVVNPCNVFAGVDGGRQRPLSRLLSIRSNEESW